MICHLVSTKCHITNTKIFCKSYTVQLSINMVTIIPK